MFRLRKLLLVILCSINMYFEIGYYCVNGLLMHSWTIDMDVLRCKHNAKPSASVCVPLLSCPFFFFFFWGGGGCIQKPEPLQTP